jgi:hypothetical protein
LERQRISTTGLFFTSFHGYGKLEMEGAGWEIGILKGQETVWLEKCIFLSPSRNLREPDSDCTKENR